MLQAMKERYESTRDQTYMDYEGTHDAEAKTSLRNQFIDTVNLLLSISELEFYLNGEGRPSESS